MMENSPLVSIIVITFNSSKFVLETLDSALKQTYPNIEIIISDDCSSDNTVTICQQWIKDHQTSGKKMYLLESKENTGTVANNNRGLNASHGEWLKFIAGDDILLPNCIEDNVNYVLKHPDAKFVFSDFIPFSVSDGKRKEWKSGVEKKIVGFFEEDAEGQLKRLLKRNVLPAPTSFLNGEIIRNIRFDESYKFLEDIPMWVKLTSQGYRMSELKSKTVLYRQQESLSKSKKTFYSPLFYVSNLQFFWHERVFLIKKYNLNEAYQYNRKAFFMSEVADLLFNNKRNFFTNCIYKTLYLMVNKWGSFKF